MRIAILQQALKPPPGLLVTKDLEAAAQRSIFEAKQAAKNAIEGQGVGRLQIGLLAGAPKLILPIDPSEDRGALLLDMGQVTLKVTPSTNS